jgi:exopolysaccharide production protein ExoY
MTVREAVKADEHLNVYVRTTPTGGLVKRFSDVVIAASALALFAPLMVVLAVLVKLFSPGPVFYGHARIGFGGRSFKCYKFRSMVTNGDEVLKDLLARDPAAREEWYASRKLRNDPRVTPIGSFLRKTSLDELPQLLNVLRGDMSIVGPRPIVAAELAYYAGHVADYMSVRPGLTGLWQISGRSDTSYEERVSLDVDYVRNWSALRDLRIMVLTVPAVLAQRGSG